MIGEPKAGTHLDGMIKLYTGWYNTLKKFQLPTAEHCKVVLERLRETKDRINEKEGKPASQWEPL